eukprot:1205437-Rhodomonas_salina.1
MPCTRYLVVFNRSVAIDVMLVPCPRAPRCWRGGCGDSPPGVPSGPALTPPAATHRDRVRDRDAETETETETETRE